MRRKIEEYYQELGLDKNEGRNCPSYVKCVNSLILQDKDKKLLPPVGAYVGHSYEDRRILFVGINPNMNWNKKYGFDSCKDWISADDAWIAGTIHRIMKKILGNAELQPEDTKDSFAFTNAVKCSTNNDFATPSDVMHINCLYQNKYLFEEIGILKPKLIVAFGDTPFNAIRNEFINSVVIINHLFTNWIFNVSIDDMSTTVIGLYNPGQGYRTPRSIFKKIREEKNIGEEWKLFMSDDLKKEIDWAKTLENIYLEKNRIDKANPFYDAIFDKLIQIAGYP